MCDSVGNVDEDEDADVNMGDNHVQDNDVADYDAEENDVQKNGVEWDEGKDDNEEESGGWRC